MFRTPPARLLPLLAAAALLPGCLNLEPRPDPTRFYVLPAATPDAAPLPDCPHILVVGPVTLPAYLDNPRLAVRRSDREIEYLAAHRWAEPLADGLGRALVAALAARQPDWCIQAFGRPGVSPAGAWQVRVDVARCELLPGGGAGLEVEWRLVRGPGGEPVTRRRLDLTVPAGEGDFPASAVAALGEAVAQWAAAVAADL